MSRKVFVIAAVVLALVVGIAPWTRSQQGNTLVVDGATLIDGTGAGPVSNSVIVIENGKITGAGPRSKVKVPAGARVIDAKGKYVIPGLIDSHVHYRSWMGELFVNNGITTVFDFGNDLDYIFGVRDTERAGKVKNMPRFYVVGAAINRPGGNYTPSQGANAGTPAGRAPAGTPMGADWARQRAKDIIARGIDAVKVTSDNLTAEEVKAITDEAHKANLKVIGHVTDVNRYVENGFDGVVHSWGMAASLMTPENKKKWGEEGTISYPFAFIEPSKIDPMIKLMIDHKAGYMPLIINDLGGLTPRAKYYADEVTNLFKDPELRYVTEDTWLAAATQFSRIRSYSQTVGEYPRVDKMTPAQLEENKRAYKNTLDFAVKYVKAGGILWLGTDTPGSGNIAGLSIRQEIESLVDAGLTPLQGIQAASKNTAEFFNKGAEVGTLQAGRWGDLIILDADPLKDISNIDKINSVIKAGEVLERKYHANYHPPFWAANEQPRFDSHVYEVPNVASVASEAASGGSTIVVKGRNFYDITVVYLNGTPLDTHFVNIGEVRANLPADQKPAAGPYNVTVRNGWPGGGASDAKPVTF